MSSLLRTFVRVPRARFIPSVYSQPRRFAHSSYGNEQSGQEQGLHETNPKVDLEHPGPKTPAQEGQGKEQGSSSGSDSSPSQSESSSSDKSSSGASPTIQTPKSAAEDTDPEVKKHNEEMEQRADRSANQLSEDDNKVDKNFWKGG